MGTQSHSRMHSLVARIDSLRDRHKALETQIEDEQKLSSPNWMRLRLLKTRKLILKDELSYYQGVLDALKGGNVQNAQSA